MSLRATKGPLLGQVFPLTNGLTLGRQDAGINLGDPRASSLHAQVSEKDGVFWLEDNKSKNGVRDSLGARVASVELIPGAVFSIGESIFTVEGESPTAPADPVPEIVVEKPKKKQVYWNEALAEFLEDNAGKFKDKIRPLHPLNPALVLEFVRGPQVNARWVIGFGPRKFGPACLDLPIWEPGAPPVCFEVFPSLDGLVFRTGHPGIVKLNGQDVDSQVLRMGDTITINETLIEVDFSA